MVLWRIARALRLLAGRGRYPPGYGDGDVIQIRSSCTSIQACYTPTISGYVAHLTLSAIPTPTLGRVLNGLSALATSLDVLQIG
jgi:hypothetical protein